jgi:hypothetical protein
LNTRYLELQEQMTETLLKYSNLEKIKIKLQSQVESYSTDLEKVCERIKLKNIPEDPAFSTGGRLIFKCKYPCILVFENLISDSI